MEYNIIVAKEKNEKFTKFIHKSIRDYNDAVSHYHREARKKEGVIPVNIIVENSDNEWVGGLSGEIYWKWLEINDFWLHESFRKNGIGAKILKQAEEIAISQGCDKAFLTTFEFQARTFYERHGYTVVGRLDDYPPGSTFYWMSKKLL